MSDRKATDRCKNCGADFADHTYIKDSITQYKCPQPHVDSGYGHFNGGDPRNFHPDGECCSPEELENHRKACALWNESEAKGKTPEPEDCPSGWIFDDKGKAIAHVLRSPYGIGTYTVEWDQYFEDLEVDDEEGEIDLDDDDPFGAIDWGGDEDEFA